MRIWVRRSPLVAAAIAWRCALVGGTGVDDRDLAGADEIGIGAEESIWAGIVGDDAADAGRDLFGHAIVDIHASIEGKLRRHGLKAVLVFSSNPLLF